MKKSLLTVLLSAGAIAWSGATFAQSGGYGSGSGGSGSDTMQQSPSDKGMKGSGGGAAGSMEKSAAPPKDVVGKDVVNAQGDKIGEVERIEGNSLVVSVGGFLGIGERNVAIPWNQVSMTGTGEDAKLTTNMSKEQLEALPETKSGTEGGSGSGSGTSGGGMGGR